MKDFRISVQCYSFGTEDGPVVTFEGNDYRVEDGNLILSDLDERGNVIEEVIISRSEWRAVKVETLLVEGEV